MANSVFSSHIVRSGLGLIRVAFLGPFAALLFSSCSPKTYPVPNASEIKIKVPIKKKRVLPPQETRLVLWSVLFTTAMWLNIKHDQE